ncbi:MAG TPA: zinc-dependent metalloprotease [Verrucomicrobiales bacterium]|nr:zinc-dependent metalloprotease [Verrucomicrobiales bacterium]
MRLPLCLTLPAALGSLALALHAQNPLQAPPAPGGNGPATIPAPPGAPAEAPPAPDFPKPDEVLKGFERVVSTADGRKSFYTLWSRGKDQQLYAELPAQYANQRHYLALTVASGDNYAGLQAGDMYFYWRSYGKRIAMVTPELDIRSTGDKSSQDSIKRLFTDRVILDVPVVTMIPNGGPVIDLDEIVLQHAEKFFGAEAMGMNKAIYKIRTAKAFANNVEIAVEVPVAKGKLRTFHYSFSLIPENTGYQPRMADERVGFFTTTYTDFGKFTPEDTQVRFINRWFLEKADPSLKLSPPKNPIIFYVEHTTPIRYRRWVKQGVEMWNKAFERIGLVNAIQVYFQDATTGEHMEKDPEDVNYNFIRWLSNGVGTAIGPSRTHPLTGQILDADIVLTDGWIRHWWKQYNDIIPQIAMEGASPETFAWLHNNPNWDPRVRLAAPGRRAEVLDQIKRSPMPALGGHPLAAAMASGPLAGKNEYDGLTRSVQFNGFCQAADWMSQGLALMDMAMATESITAAPGEQMVDGIPESFIGPLLSDLTVHEVGHTLGLRHNFKGSTIYSYSEINGDGVKGKKAFTGSVMDYIPINIVAKKGTPQGDYGMIQVGPYDEWAIEYGYTFEKDLKPILAKNTQPELTYGTDEDTGGPDPRARRYDFAKDPIAFAENQMSLVREHRGKLLDKFVKDGDSWAKARRGYQLTLQTQVQSVMMMANWLGGSLVNRNRKGDPNATVPVEPVPAAQQRDAIKFVLANTFPDDAYGLSPNLLKYLTVDKWFDLESHFDEPNWPVHDRVLGIQASAMTAMLNPVTLSRVFDNEFRTPSDQDALTLPEVLNTVRGAAWTELDNVDAAKKYSDRQPLVSSLRRNLQREHVDRLMDLANNKLGGAPAAKPISDLAATQLTELRDKLKAASGNGNLDNYTRAHFSENAARITKALEARYVIVK